MEKIIFSSAFRQLLNGAFSLGAISLLIKGQPGSVVAAFNSDVAVSYILSSIIGIAFYPGIYFLGSNKKSNIQSLNLIVLASIALSTLFCLGLYLVANFLNLNFIYNNQIFLIWTSIVAGFMPAVSLSRCSYKMYNILEILQPLIFFISVFAVYSNALDARYIILTYGVSFFIKAAIYFVVYAPNWRHGFRGHYHVLDGLKYGVLNGFSGCYQTVAFKSIFLILTNGVDINFNRIYSIFWPIVEKCLVIPQAVNSIMFGQLRNNKINKKMYIKIIFFIGAVELFLLLGFYYYFRINKANELNIGIAVILIQLIIVFMQSIRIMIHTYLSVRNKMHKNIIDTSLVLIFCLLGYVGGLYFGINSYFQSIIIILGFSGSLYKLFGVARNVA